MNVLKWLFRENKQKELGFDIFIRYYYDLRITVIEKYGSYSKSEFFSDYLKELFVDLEDSHLIAKSTMKMQYFEIAHSKLVWLNYEMDQWAKDFLQESNN